ncbi:60S acidic ribosomal protein P1-like [Manduca sexta]|uniref:60S acidic ribosomal protein P1-like n=1 Tax=Manduca sexta TaxID=7130 RepID=UPI00188DD666|nr:60S acidic ribosomal protein P1-like [Manduca sexta]
MASKSDLACIYFALILVDDDVTISVVKTPTILKAASRTTSPTGRFFKRRTNVRDLIIKIGSGDSAPPAAGAPAAHAAEAAKEQK